jgi:hypothetical protein
MVNPSRSANPFPVPRMRATKWLGNVRETGWLNVVMRFLLSGTWPLPAQSTKLSAEDGRTAFRQRDPDQKAALFDHGGAIVVQSGCSPEMER